jgi:hypothetical protein
MTDQSSEENKKLLDFGNEITAICDFRLVRGMVELVTNPRGLSPMELMGKVVELLDDSSTVDAAKRNRLQNIYIKHYLPGYIQFLEKQNSDLDAENHRLNQAVRNQQTQLVNGTGDLLAYATFLKEQKAEREAKRRRLDQTVKTQADLIADMNMRKIREEQDERDAEAQRLRYAARGLGDGDSRSITQSAEQEVVVASSIDGDSSD